jgi:hypothetical protein
VAVEAVDRDGWCGVNGQQMRELATAALQAAMREDWPAVRQAFAGISTDSSATTFALVAWCDWTIQAQAEMQGLAMPAAGPMPGIARPGWLNMDTGKVTLDADEMPPVVRWCGQLIAARAAMDMAAFNALIGTLPGDGVERGEYAAALLTGCAEMVGMWQKRAAS